MFGNSMTSRPKGMSMTNLMHYENELGRQNQTEYESEEMTNFMSHRNKCSVGNQNSMKPKYSSSQRKKMIMHWKC